MSSGAASVRPRVVLIDDDPVYRKMGRVALTRAAFDVVGEAATAHEGIELVQRERPDLVLLDVHLPDMDGFGVMAQLRRNSVESLIVLLSSGDADQDRPRAAQAGVAYLPKSTPVGNWAQILHQLIRLHGSSSGRRDVPKES